MQCSRNRRANETVEQVVLLNVIAALNFIRMSSNMLCEIKENKNKKCETCHDISYYYQ